MHVQKRMGRCNGCIPIKYSYNVIHIHDVKNCELNLTLLVLLAYKATLSNASFGSRTLAGNDVLFCSVLDSDVSYLVEESALDGKEVLRVSGEDPGGAGDGPFPPVEVVQRVCSKVRGKLLVPSSFGTSLHAAYFKVLAN